MINTRYAPYVHSLYYVHIYTHNSMRKKKVQQIIHRPDKMHFLSFFVAVIVAYTIDYWKTRAPE